MGKTGDSAPIDANLTAIVEAWQTLAEPIKACILALIRSPRTVTWASSHASSPTETDRCTWETTTRRRVLLERLARGFILRTRRPCSLAGRQTEQFAGWNALRWWFTC